MVPISLRFECEVHIWLTMKAQPATIEYLSCSPSEAIAQCISEVKCSGGKR